VVVVDNAPVTFSDGVVWVQPGRRAFEARAGGMASRVVLEIPDDGRVTDVDLAVSVPSSTPSTPSTPSTASTTSTTSTAAPAHASAARSSSSTSSATSSSTSSSTAPSASATSNTTGSNGDGDGNGNGFVVGAGVAGAGLLIGAIGGALWVAMDNALGAPMHPDQRHLLEGAGVGGVGLVAVGTGAVVVGTVLAVSP